MKLGRGYGAGERAMEVGRGQQGRGWGNGGRQGVMDLGMG